MFLVALLAALAIAAPINQNRVRLELNELPIPGKYIAVFKADATQAAVSALAAQFAESKLHKIGSFKALSLELSQAQLEILLEKTDILDYVSQDGVAYAASIQTNPPSWGLDRIDQEDLPLNNQFAYPNSAGSGSSVYVLDTGIRITHTQFGTRARWGANFAGGSNTDGNGHGTHCAGTVGGNTVGVAKSSVLVAVKVLGDSGSGSWSGVISGMEWVVSDCGTKSRCSGSLSLGGGANQAVDDALNAVVSQGVTMVVAAGNNNGNACSYSPARAASAICVGATDINDNRASYSNYGSCLEIFAPGSNIYSAWYTSDTAYNTISGTSMACPHVAGTVALLQSVYGGRTPAQALSTLQSQATPNAINNVGSGSPNLMLFTAESM